MSTSWQYWSVLLVRNCTRVSSSPCVIGSWSSWSTVRAIQKQHKEHLTCTQSTPKILQYLNIEFLPWVFHNIQSTFTSYPLNTYSVYKPQKCAAVNLWHLFGLDKISGIPMLQLSSFIKQYTCWLKKLCCYHSHILTKNNNANKLTHSPGAPLASAWLPLGWTERAVQCWDSAQPSYSLPDTIRIWQCADAAIFQNLRSQVDPRSETLIPIVMKKHSN